MIIYMKYCLSEKIKTKKKKKENKIKTAFLFGNCTITVTCKLHFGKPFIYTLKNSNILNALGKPI